MTDTDRIETIPGAVRIRAKSHDDLHLPNLWLRDNCACNTCRDMQTGEKKFLVSQVGADIAPSKTDLDGDVLAVTWPDGHESVFSLVAIRALREPRHPRWQPWPVAYTPLRVRWSELLDDDARAIEALTAFLRSGALVLSDAPTEPGALELLAARLGPLREVEFARIHNVEVDPRGYNVAHTAQALPPHNDFASYAWPPSVQALHMLANEVAGGKSIIVDGFSLLENFRAQWPRHFDCLCRVPVPFSMLDASTITWAEAPLIRLDSAGDVIGLRFSNQLMRTMDPTRDGVEDFYRAYHVLCQFIGDPAYRATFRLNSGNVLLVAAHRVLHAREAFEPTGRRQLQDAYFELDNIANRLVVLRRNRSKTHD